MMIPYLLEDFLYRATSKYQRSGHTLHDRVDMHEDIRYRIIRFSIPKCYEVSRYLYYSIMLFWLAIGERAFVCVTT